MIVAGIDEAGYGPLLGPLVVGCCAFEVEPEGAGGESAPASDADDDDATSDGPPGSAASAVAVRDAPPCLWKRLRKHVSKNRTKNGRKLHVNDSKVVYAPAAGLKELERS